MFKKFLMLTLSVLFSLGQMWGASYTITFANNAGSATSITSTVNASTVIASTSTSYVETKPFTPADGTSNYYGDTKTCIRLGKSGNAGGLSIALSANGKVNATSVVVKCYCTGNKNSGATITCNGSNPGVVPADSYDDVTLDLNGSQITSLTLSTTKSVYITSITVNYGSVPSSVTAPTFDVAAGTFLEYQNIKVSNYDGNLSYFYTTDGTAPSETSTAYVHTAGVSINSSCTLKMIAVDGEGNKSNVTSAAYVINKYASLEALAAANLADGTYVTVSFENVAIKSFYINGSGYRNGVYFDIQKAGKDIEIYFQNVPEGWVAEGKLSGTITNCKWTVYSGTWELAPASGWAWTNLSYTAPKAVSGIAVKTAPTKVIYTEGEKFDPAGLAITVTYTEGDPEDVAYAGNESKFTFAPALDAELATSNDNVTITYGGQTATQTITVNEKPSHNVKFYVNGDQQGETMSVKEGVAVTFPEDPTAEGKTFMGWTATEDYFDEATAPADLCKEATMGTSPLNFYAVFATKTEGANGWQLCKVAPAAGDDVLFVGKKESKYYMMKVVGETITATEITFNTDNQTINTTACPVTDYTWTASTQTVGTNTGLSFKIGTGSPLHINNSAIKTANSYQNGTFEFTANGDGFEMKSNQNGRWLKFDGGDKPTFTYSNTAVAILIFKNFADVSYSDYTTIVAADDHTSAAVGAAAWENMTEDYNQSMYKSNGNLITKTAVGNHGTICLPYAATVTGAVVYEYKYAEYNEGNVVTGLVFDFVTGVKETSNCVEAGKAYVYFATEGTQYWTRNNTTAEDVAVPEQDLKLVGTYSQISLLNGEYFLHTEDDMFHPAGNNVVVPAFRAYITGMPVYGTPAPVRMILPKTGVATGVENAADYKAVKALVDGKIVILRGAKSYNVAGQAL